MYSNLQYQWTNTEPTEVQLQLCWNSPVIYNTSTFLHMFFYHIYMPVKIYPQTPVKTLPQMVFWITFIPSVYAFHIISICVHHIYSIMFLHITFILLCFCTSHLFYCVCAHHIYSILFVLHITFIQLSLCILHLFNSVCPH